MRKWIYLCGALAGCLAAGAAAATPPGGGKDAVWPCAQPRTPTISAAAIWAGPDIAKAGAWDDDLEAAELAQKLASRRTPMSDVDGLLDAFAANAGADKDVRLTHVFAGVLELINIERDRVISGIVRYAKGQEQLAARVRKDGEAVADAQEADAESPNAKLSDANSSGGKASDSEPAQAQPGDAQPSKAEVDAATKLKWDKRIFDERSRSLTYVCETPTLLEQRAFEIARRIQQKL